MWYNDSYLMHYGVLGMKWGVRRYQNKDGTYTDAGLKRKSNAKSDRAARRAIRKDRKQANKRRSQLSDDELDARIKRLQKEKQLRELTESEVSRGKQFTSTLTQKLGAVAATALVGAAVYAGKTIITGKVDVSEIGNYVFPNPNKKK